LLTTQAKALDDPLPCRRENPQLWFSDLASPGGRPSDRWHLRARAPRKDSTYQVHLRVTP